MSRQPLGLRWSLGETLVRVGAPASVMFIGYTIRDLVRRPAGESASDVVLGSLYLFLAIWLGVSVLLWAATRAFPPPPRR